MLPDLRLRLLYLSQREIWWGSHNLNQEMYHTCSKLSYIAIRKNCFTLPLGKKVNKKSMQNFVKYVRFNSTFFYKFYCKVCLTNLNVNIHWEDITGNIAPLEYADVQTLFKGNKYDVVQFNFQSSKFLWFKSRFSRMRTLKHLWQRRTGGLCPGNFFKCNKFCSSLVLNSVLADLVIRKMGECQEDHAARCTLHFPRKPNEIVSAPE